jgi:hypothetical protein
MEQSYIGDEASDILRRLAAVDVSKCKLDADRGEYALNEYLSRLGLPKRRVRWAHGAQRGWKMAVDNRSRLDTVAISMALRNAATSDEKKAVNGKAWDEAQRAVQRARNAAAWSNLLLAVKMPEKVTVREGHVYWRGYVDEKAWGSAREAAHNAVMAAGEFARLHAAGDDSETQRRFAKIRLPLLDAYEAGVWLFWVMTDEVIAVRRPEMHLRDGRLHGDCQPAAIWPDGEHYHFLSGVRVTEDIAMTPAEELDARLVITERNAEVRREIVRKIGLSRLLWKLGSECVDKKGDYELLLLELGDGRRRPFLRMKNPSTGDYHVEGVDPYCFSVAEALEWRNDTDIPPSALT